MPEPGERVEPVLDGYAKFLHDKELALPKHQSYLVRWVREFLVFAGEDCGYTFEQTLDLFLAEVGRRLGIKPWQVQQAAEAVRIYRYRYRGSKSTRWLSSGPAVHRRPAVGTSPTRRLRPSVRADAYQQKKRYGSSHSSGTSR
jgi:hypothetical protein